MINEYKKCKYCKMNICIEEDICIRCEKLLRRMALDLRLTKRLLKAIEKEDW